MNINPKSLQAYRLLHHGIIALARAEQNGIRVDLDYVTKQKQEITARINQLETNFKNTNFYKRWEHSTKNAININSNPQLSHYLYNVRKIAPARITESGQGSTDEDALQQLNIPELNDLLEIRKLKKIRDTYLDSFEREQVAGYVHPFFNLHLVRTYRSSSDHPNFQNIPIRDEESMQITRKALYPRPGNQFLEADYSGLEVRIAACYHKDPVMLKYINDPKSDMHADMAKQLFMIDKFDKSIPAHATLRNATKNGFVFPQFYGDYYKNCASYLACDWGKLPQGKWKSKQGIVLNGGTLSDHFIAKGIKSLDAFTEHVKKIEDNFWNDRFKAYRVWKDKHYAQYLKNGYVDLLTGFRCHGVMSRNDAINYPVQGAAFHCLLWSFIELDRISQSENWDTRLIGQIHDSIILDVNPAELDMVIRTIHRVTCKDLPIAWDWIKVPLDVEMAICPVDGNWSEKSKLNFI